MNRETQSIVTIMLGGLIAAITASGRFTSYVKPGFEPILWAASAILVLVGIVTLIMTIREEVATAKAEELAKVAAAASGSAVDLAVSGGHTESHDHADAHGHTDAHGHNHSKSKAAWLLMVPVLVLLLVPPNALGADSVVRSATSQDIAGSAASSGSGASGSGGEQRRTMPFPALTASADLSMTMKEFVMRTLYDAQDSTSKGTFVIEGFIVPVSKGYTTGYGIARLVISCCAADANPMQVHIDGDAPLPVNTWVSATVTAVAQTGSRENQYVPTVTVVSMQQIAQPKDPYEH